MDNFYNVPEEFIREEMYVKPTDLGPLYIAPFKAIVYYMDLNKVNKQEKLVMPS